MKWSITVFIILIFEINFSFGQVDIVVDEVESSSKYYENAFKKIKNGLAYIDECYSLNTIYDVQDVAGYAEYEISSAQKDIGYAEDKANNAKSEASSIKCSDAEAEASDAVNYFYSAKGKLNNAISELSSAPYEEDFDFLLDYISTAESYINQAITDLDSAVDELNNVHEELKGCTVNAKNYSQSSVSCKELIEFIEVNGRQEGKVSSYITDSSLLKTITAYSYDHKIYVVAEIKESEYSYKTNSYIFCGIPSNNWTDFRYAGYGGGDSLGERFKKYIFDYKCDCE